MKKKLIIIGVVILIAAFLIINNNSGDPPNVERCEQTYSEPGEIEDKIFCIAKETREEKYCAELSGASDRNLCYRMIAVFENDVKICDNIANEAWKESCILSIADSYEDETVCSLVDDELARDGCYITVAVKKQDMAICENIREINERKAKWYCLYHSNESNPSGRSLNQEREDPDWLYLDEYFG